MERDARQWILYLSSLATHDRPRAQENEICAGDQTCFLDLLVANLRVENFRSN